MQPDVLNDPPFMTLVGEQEQWHIKLRSYQQQIIFIEKLISYYL